MDVDLGHLKEPCVCGKSHEVSVESVYIEAGACARLMDILETYQNPVFICDSNTRAAAEPFLEEEFKDYPVIELNPEGLLADNRGVKKVMTQLDYCDRGLSSVSVDVLVAIGGGTIHDLTRYAAQEYEIPFVSIPTAASGDGFAANVVALTWDGMKKTVPAASPRWILADTDILVKAPSRLTAAGVADLLGKYTALLDWRVAHLVTGEYICEEVCELEERAIRDVCRELDEIRERDPEATEKLMYALIMAGLAMQMVGGSWPVSGAEHHMTHFWEMEVVNPKLDSLHGDRVGVGLVLVVRYYKKLQRAIRKGQVRIKSSSARGLEMEMLEKTFGDKELVDSIIMENTPNPLDEVDLEKLEELLPQIEDLLDDLPDEDVIIRKLQEGGCRTQLSQIGLSDDLEQISLECCPYVKNRLTLLRLSKLLEW